MIGRILFFDDADDLAIFSHHAAQAERVGLLHRQNAQLVAAGRLHQAAQRVGGGQGHVAVQDQRWLRIVKLGQRLHDGVAGTQLRFLQGGVDAGVVTVILPRDHLRHRCAPMPVNHA